ncbi:UDP-N-acetylmuramoyl-L-alanine--D-glutamate ligase [Caldichromatium japonicum]|uniref:UDP-N-acetylmuramoylalanine--D-glutamate ligase n=2 Tax=Caldichromatium japonicum TaxID=2699430 RepID=A0A6G7VH63_9GAMM|nr:UDP-N-acetylmuramoyl-L-alanine--D-glutamate ligase [Caldichromatium japonicum]
MTPFAPLPPETTAAAGRAWHEGPFILVLGIGKTGLSCARYLRAQGASVAVADTRVQPPCLDALRAELPEVPVFLGGFTPEVFARATEFILSPGVPLSEPLVQESLARGMPVRGDIALFAQAAQAPICAITGSNGKSTVTTLVGEMAARALQRVAVGGNLGTPALDLLDPGVELYVLELSSFQLETTEGLAPQAAAVLNLSPDHLDRYASLDDYAQAKARIYRDARVAIVNRDDPIVAAMPRAAEREIGFTLREPQGTDFGLRRSRGQIWLYQGERPLMPAAEVRLAGRHNLANALAALALADACSIPEAIACAVLREFAGLPHRCVLVAERQGVRWYDDSKGTNPGATIAALEGLLPEDATGRVVLIAGGLAKGADFSPLRDPVRRAARAVILIGQDAPLIAAALDGAAPLVRAADLDEAVHLADTWARPGDCVLLSPACASFDMFANYEHRGRAFAEAVLRLPT